MSQNGKRGGGAKKRSATNFNAELASYLDKLVRYPIPDREEFDRLHARWQKTGDAEAFDRMLYGNTGLVISAVRRYVGRGVGLEDLAQEGFLGLAKAIEKYAPAAGAAFSTYAFHWIRQAVVRCIENTGVLSPYRVPVGAQQVRFKTQRLINRFNAEHGCDPTIEELTEMLNRDRDEPISPKAVAQAVELLNRRFVSLNQSVDTSDANGDELGSILNIGDGDTERLGMDKIRSVIEAWETAKRVCDEREFEILERRFIGGESYGKIAAGMGGRFKETVTRQAIDQTRKIALDRIGKRLGISRKQVTSLLCANNDSARLNQGIKSVSVTTPDEALQLLAEHLINRPTGQRIIKAPINTLAARTNLARRQCEALVITLIQEGRLAGSEPWDVVELKADVIVPPRNEKARPEKGQIRRVKERGWQVPSPGESKTEVNRDRRGRGRRNSIRNKTSVAVAYEALSKYANGVSGLTTVRGARVILETLGLWSIEAEQALAKLEKIELLVRQGSDWRTVILLPCELTEEEMALPVLG